MITSNNSIQIALLFSILSIVATGINLFLTIKRDNKKDTKESLEEKEKRLMQEHTTSEGIMKANLKLDQLCITTSGINSQLEKLNDRVNEIAIKQERHEIRIKMLEEK